MGWVGDLDQLGWYMVQTILDLSLINRVMNLIEIFFSMEIGKKGKTEAKVPAIPEHLLY